MKKYFITIIVAIMLVLAGCSCSKEADNAANTSTSRSVNEENKDMTAKNNTYKQIGQEEAKEMMKRDDGHIIVDVRRQDEYDNGHIAGAVLIPNESIVVGRGIEVSKLHRNLLIWAIQMYMNLVESIRGMGILFNKLVR